MSIQNPDSTSPELTPPSKSAFPQEMYDLWYSAFHPPSGATSMVAGTPFFELRLKASYLLFHK